MEMKSFASFQTGLISTFAYSTVFMPCLLIFPLTLHKTMKRIENIAMKTSGILKSLLKCRPVGLLSVIREFDTLSSEKAIPIYISLSFFNESCVDAIYKFFFRFFLF